MLDKKAIKILFKRYWSSSGWTDNFISRRELDYAKDAGVMFEQIELSHDDMIDRLMAIVNKLSLKEVTDQFIASLSTRRLDLRSALGSYMVGRHIVHHVFAGEESYCTYCGAFSKDRERQDLNVLSFERFKWGGVRHLDPLYILFDLEQFDKTEKLVPLTMDYEIFNEIIKTIIDLHPEARVRVFIAK